MNPRPTFFETAKAIVASREVQTLIDTTDEGHPSEACLYGEGIKLVEERFGSERWLTLNGPDGEISLPANCWAQIAKSMGVVLAVVSA